jgi:5-methyltetrahydropteroyltriglutamate--homocysteine methyltransferase
MQKSDGRILTTHAGSLPRPAGLTELFARRIAGARIDEAELDRLAAKAVADIVPKQIAAGIDIGNNGEQTREAFFLYVRRRMTGFSGQGGRPPFADVAAYPGFMDHRKTVLTFKPAISNLDPPKVTGEVRYIDPAAIEDECAQFRQVLDAQPKGFVEPFLTAPSPGIIAAAVQNEHYDTFENYVEALAQALAVEYRAVVDAGFLLQLDCPDLALERHVTFQDKPVSAFVDFIDLIIASINRALDGIPRDRVRLHVCWGNYEGPHDRDVALADIQGAIFRANVGGFMFPTANPRHAHEYRLFSSDRLADDQVVIAGVIDTVTNYIEHPEVVADRIERVAQALGDPSRVIAGTDCGFDTSAGMGRVAEDVVWAKLRALREGADIASQRLFG